MRQDSLFGDQRLQMTESIDLTIASPRHYGPDHRHWAVAWSGGKDSTALVTLVVYLIESGKVPRPETFTVLYADTRLELLPLWLSAKVVHEPAAMKRLEQIVHPMLGASRQKFFQDAEASGAPAVFGGF